MKKKTITLKVSPTVLLLAIILLCIVWTLIRLPRREKKALRILLSNDEMDSLTNQLFACSNVNYTPDGRAILCILPQSDIEHLLG